MFCGLRLASTRLPTDNDGLVLVVATHAAKSLFGNGKDVWVKLTKRPPTVCVNDVVGIDGDAGIWVERHQHNTAVRVDGLLLLESDPQVVYHWRAREQKGTRKGSGKSIV